MLIGCGHHARRIYVPSIIKISKKEPVKIRVIVDVVSEQEIISKYLKKLGISPEVMFIEEANSFTGDIPASLVEILNCRVKKFNINAVVISTDPIYHRAYAEWALENNLHILMDKPITTRPNAVTDPAQARMIYTDYVKLMDKYNKAQDYKKTAFIIMTQRRYENGFKKVFELISSTAERFNIPVTSIQAMHSDGVWIFPDEIVEQTHHSYNTGNGKCSHSGYHIFDIVWQLYLAGMRIEKIPDSAEVTTSFVQPMGLLEQFSQDDYRRLFGPTYDERPRRCEEQLHNIMLGYGENDAFSILKLLKNNINICNISINLLHNSFSRRSSIIPAVDLYKSNGRVKHQYYYIQQGPFQCIQIHNYQSDGKHDVITSSDYDLGGNNHFEIHIFRNSYFFGKDIKPLEIIKLNNIDTVLTSNDDRLHNETAKDLAIIEFVEFILGRKKRSDLTSNIETHVFPVKLMSAIYESHSNQSTGLGSPSVRFSLDS